MNSAGNTDTQVDARRLARISPCSLAASKARKYYSNKYP